MSRLWHIITAAACTALLLASAACGNANGSAHHTQDEPLTVTASINQWGTLAKELGGDLVTVSSIINSTNVEAHDYEPTTADVKRLCTSAVTIVNGADYDSWALKAATNGNGAIVNAAQSGGKKDGDNPHVWFSAKVRTATADAITSAYRKAMPAKADEFTKLNRAWHNRETELEERIAKTREATKGMRYGATESVARYLADDLGMVDRTPAGYTQAIANDSEPTPSDITQFVSTLTSKRVAMLILNPQEANAMTNQLTDTAKRADVPVVEISEQMPDTYDSLLDWMSALVSAIGHTS